MKDQSSGALLVRSEWKEESKVLSSVDLKYNVPVNQASE